MSQKFNPQHSKIDHLEESLYSKDTASIRTKSGSLHTESISVSKDWSAVDQNEDEAQLRTEQNRIQSQGIIYKKQSSFFKKFFISSLLFFFVAVGFGVYTFFIKNKIYPEGNISIGIVGSTFTKAGEELPLTVEIHNKNDFPLEVVDLIIEYPREGDKPTASLETTERSRVSLGSIEPQKRVLKNIPITLFGKEGDRKDIYFTLEYTIPNSSTIFQKQKIYTVTLSSSPIIIRILGGEIAVPNQPYRFIVEMSTNTRNPIDNILLALDYPVGFTFESATIPPNQNKNLWNIGTLVPGVPKQIEITGVFSGIEGDERSIRALFGTYLSSNPAKINTNLGTLIQTVTLEKPFLSTNLEINGSSNKITHLSPGDPIQGTIQWKNNLLNPILDLEIKLHLQGDLLDRAHLDVTDGFYDSSTDTLIWNKNTIDKFVRIGSGENGILYFRIPTIPPAQDGTVKNPQVDFEVTVRALEDSEDTIPKTIESLERTSVHIGGNIMLNPVVRFSTGDIQNSGSFPPKVNTETTYTVQLDITNTVNDYTNGVFRAKLAPNVVFTNVFIPKTELVNYDEKTGEIIWNVGTIPQKSTTARSVSFQLKVLPSLSQIGQYIPLLKESTFTATDSFTKQNTTQNIAPITTEISRTIENNNSLGQVVK